VTDDARAIERSTREAFGRAMELALPLLDAPDPRDPAVEAGWLVATAPEPNELGTGRLRGLGIAVKDVIDVAGMPVRNGTPGFWREPASSAPAWQALLDAGAHCVGKSATHEMAWGVTTPEIPHPADPTRIAGGSSGGSAACVAAGVAVGALGTDTGGSIRIPAALCGVVGLRPTTGSVAMAGITPLAPSQDVVGPIARDVRTCAALAEVLLGRPLDLTPGTALAGLRVGVLADPGPLDDETSEAYDAVLHGLRDLGVEVVPCSTSLPRESGGVSLLTMLHESAALHADVVEADPERFGGEARALLTLGRPLAARAGELVRARTRLGAATLRLYAEKRLDAFLTPTTSCSAPRRDSPTVRLGGRQVPVPSALTRFTAWAAATGLPAVSVPGPSSGLPVGIQVMARPLAEPVCLQLALAVEGLAAVTTVVADTDT
jgi:aspartyl-tRNA(Asn)/glutamyl-tRNA(Gln) amidotransferase subunit A